jgi:hypothetical protein
MLSTIEFELELFFLIIIGETILKIAFLFVESSLQLVILCAFQTSLFFDFVYDIPTVVEYF